MGAPVGDNELRLGTTADGEPLALEPRDLTTHGVIVGMTGSGKTGLGLVLLEEALSAGVPVLALDPKGDLGNLLLTFPDLAPASFQPWVNESDAREAGLSVEEYAAKVAAEWREGLAASGIGPERIQALRDAAELTDLHARLERGRPAQSDRLAAGAGALVGDGGRDAPRRDRGHGDEPARARRDSRPNRSRVASTCSSRTSSRMRGAAGATSISAR